jgi:hypothetical protein
MTTFTLIPAVATTLAPFMGPLQTAMVKELIDGEEGQYFCALLDELAQRVNAMPSTGETDGQGDKAVAYLHYFYSGCDWYITERDIGDGSDDHRQHQAFGFVNLGDPQNAELGYISLPEIFSVNAELDFHWSSKTLREIKAKIGR